MYAAIWRMLPGPPALRALLALLLILAVVAALFLWIFPWAQEHLPFLNVTVDQAPPANP